MMAGARTRSCSLAAEMSEISEMSESATRIERLYRELADSATRDRAARELLSVGPDEAEEVVAFSGTLADAGDPNRFFLARTLGQLGAAGVRAVPRLRAWLLDADPGLRQNAALALGMIGGRDAETAAMLHGALADDSAMVRTAAAWALRLLGDQDRAALDELVLASRDRDPARRSWGVSGLCDALSLDESVCSLLIELIAHADDDAGREEVARAIASANTATRVPRLLDALAGATGRGARGILEAMVELGPRAAAFRIAIIECLAAHDLWHYPDRDVRRLIANVAQAVPLDHPEIVVRLVALLDDRDDWVREQAAHAVLALASSTEPDRSRAAEILGAAQGSEP